MSEALPQIEIKTNFGAMVFELFEDDVPNTVANFISLVEAGFYNGTRSHRVIKNFMVQLGDPNTKDPKLENRWGTGGPGYGIDCEWEGAGNQVNEKGTLSMAHAGRDTGGSQFFINHKYNDFLDNRHTVFGRIVQGMDVLDAICSVPTTMSRSGENSKPTQEIIVEQMSVLQKRSHPYTVKKNANR